MSQHFSTLQNITEQIINSTLVLHFFPPEKTIWKIPCKNPHLSNSRIIVYTIFMKCWRIFLQHSLREKKVHKTGLKMLFKCSELRSVSWKSSWQRHVANWKFVVIIIMAKLSKVSKLLKGCVIFEEKLTYLEFLRQNCKFETLKIDIFG